MTTYTAAAAERVVQWMIDNGIERVIDPSNISERDEYGEVCRVCAVSAAMFSDAVPDRSTRNKLSTTIRDILLERGDCYSILRTVPDTAALIALIREAGARADGEAAKT